MANIQNTLTLTTTLVSDHWEITGSMSAGTLPQEIFIYSNTGTNILGTYKGICSLDELSRLQVFSGTAIPVFGNRFVRYGLIAISVPLTTDTTLITATILQSVQSLSSAYKAALNSTQVYTIT